MKTLLIRNAHCVATFDDADPTRARELRDASVLVRGNLIEAIGPADTLPQTADEVIDARGQLVMPGLINTHHHMYQSPTRAIPAVQNAELFSWLRGLYPIWAGLTPEMVQVSTQVSMAELLVSGCTTSSDHLYIYPNGVRLDDSIEAARTIGMRFVACRGSMSVGQSQGGLPPDAVVEREADILADSQRLIDQFHDAAHGSMLQIALAPCSPFSISPDLMRETAMLLARVGRAMAPPATDANGKLVYGCDAGPAQMHAREALAMATRGGAQVLGRSDIGHLAPGMCADLALFDLRTLAFAGGAVHDPVAALVLCASPQASHTIVNGRVLVRDGQLVPLALAPLLERHNQLAQVLAR